MSQSLSLLFALWVMALTGCSSMGLSSSDRLAKPSPEESPASARLTLLPPAEGPDAVLLTQKVTLEAWGQQRQFLVVTRLLPGQTQLVALLPTGQQLLSLVYDGDVLSQQTLPSVDIPGEEILAILQFALWPQVSVRAHYPSSAGWQVVASDERRALLTPAGVRLDVSYLSDGLKVNNYQSDYRVWIQTLERKVL